MESIELLRRQGLAVQEGTTFAEATLLASQQAPKLTMPAEPAQFDPSAPPKMALYRPAQAAPAGGRHAALVLAHTCGLPSGDTQLNAWTREALDRGYVVLVLDSWSQRGIQEFCGVRSDVKWTPPGVRTGDAFAALTYLRQLSYIDPDRIGFAGFSQGAWPAFRVASRSVSEAFVKEQRGFAAAVASYGPCRRARSTRTDFILPDISVPLLVMMGEKDEEASPKVCTPPLELAKSRGAPVEWHVLPYAHHAWDNQNFISPRIVPQRALGTAATYAYSPRAAEDSRKRGLDFLDRHLKRGS